MNGIRNNVVFCGFNEIERNSFWLNDIRKDVMWEKGVYYDEITKALKHRFPYVIYEESYKCAEKHQGFALFLKVKYSKIVNMSKREIDIYYRSRFFKYTMIYLYNEKFDNKKLNKFSNVIFIGEKEMNGELDDFMNKEYFYYLENKNKIENMSFKMLNRINDLKKYLQVTKVSNSKEISNKFGVSVRSIQRYMHMLNDIYNCIGYDYYKDEWYYIGAKKSF